MGKIKPHEILQKIIDEKGNCDWAIPTGIAICDMCPMGGNKSCATFVNKRAGSWKDEDYVEVAKKLLADLEVSRIILGEESEE